MSEQPTPETARKPDILVVATIVQDNTGCKSGPAVAAAARVLIDLEEHGWIKEGNL